MSLLGESSRSCSLSLHWDIHVTFAIPKNTISISIPESIHVTSDQGPDYQIGWWLPKKLPRSSYWIRGCPSYQKMPLLCSSNARGRLLVPSQMIYLEIYLESVTQLLNFNLSCLWKLLPYLKGLGFATKENHCLRNYRESVTVLEADPRVLLPRRIIVYETIENQLQC
jgi:hypothetical protein